jgi:hypothetical protein
VICLFAGLLANPDMPLSRRGREKERESRVSVRVCLTRPLPSVCLVRSWPSVFLFCFPCLVSVALCVSSCLKVIRQASVESTALPTLPSLPHPRSLPAPVPQHIIL